MALPLKLPWDLAQNRWASQLNPIIANPTTNLSLLKDINLVTGTNVINHHLGETQQGWIVTDIQGAATIYRNAPYNDKTLSLFSSATVTITIGVF